jgi:hypothetical protein
MRRPNRLLAALAPVVVQAEGWQALGDAGAP